MVANDDPNQAGEVAVLTIAAVVFAAIAVRLYRPPFATEGSRRVSVSGRGD
jgi:hypothetical protein